MSRGVSGASSVRGLGVDPVVDRVRPLIHDKLRAVEKSHGLRVLFACESGSRAWGFASDDSDFDVRFIFVRPAEDYLRLLSPTDAFDLHDGGDFDLAGWDIRKTAELLRKSNSPLLEWIDSPIVYEADPLMAARLGELRTTYFDVKKSAYHYLSLAGKVFARYLETEQRPIRKKYLYALRPLACVAWMSLHGTQPPTVFDSVLEGIDLEATVRDAIARLVVDKKANAELGRDVRDDVLHGWMVAALDRGQRFADAAEPANTPIDALDALVVDAILGARQGDSA